ncbi:MAG: Hydroxyacylglutathione hydrolase [Verrucomicrobiae bacterium]|nr:Hydroxyacylglutathione hydrolase [Verrucomicrobiae bacterium]
MKIPLEDFPNDIIGKAQRGLKLPDETNPAKLGLSAAALQALEAKAWYPNDPGTIAGLACFNTPFQDMTVNSYVVFDPVSKEAAAFDTGADCSGMLQLGVKIQQIFLTHIHTDHVMELDLLKEKTGAKAYVSEREPLDGAEPFADGRTFQIGSLKVETRRTSGHAKGGVTYVVTGLAKRLAIVGDAVFAGSMGGGAVSYAEALRTNKESILTLPDDTVICPGHGPLTTVGEEKLHNPFFAK